MYLLDIVIFYLMRFDNIKTNNSLWSKVNYDNAIRNIA
jgi:hypothetical protein